MIRRKFVRGLTAVSAALALSVAFASPSQAEFPQKPIKIIVPYNPGGSTDVLVRLTAKHLEPILGQQIIIANIAGAGGSVGMFEASRARPDGYTLGMYLTNSEVAMATGVASFKSDELVPVAHLGKMFLTITGKGDGPFKGLQDMKAAAEKKPGEIGVAMGQGMLAHFAAAMVEEGMGVDLNLVNVGGGAKKKAAVIGGHVDTMAEPTPGILAQHKSGQLKMLAVLAPERLPFLPDVPTAKEQGFDVVSIQTNGFFAPKGTPAENIKVIADAVAKLSDDAAYQKRLEELNLVWDYMGPDEFAAYMKTLHAQIQATAEKMGVKK